MSEENLSDLISVYMSQANIKSLEEVTLEDELQIWQKTCLSYSAFKKCTEHILKNCNKKTFVSVLDMPEWTRVTSACDSIDAILDGGFSSRGITEIFGQSGVGKTQLCLQTALAVQLPVAHRGLNKGAIYICTEDSFPSKRLKQIADYFRVKFNDRVQYEHRIYIKHIVDYNQLHECLSVAVPNLLKYHNIGVIIIDSIAGVFRTPTEKVDFVSRSKQLFSIAQKLLQFSKQYDCAVICTNQVTDNVKTGEVLPCLGISWSNLLTYRLHVKRLLDKRRECSVVFSPDLPNKSCLFSITNCGVVEQ